MTTTTPKPLPLRSMLFVPGDSEKKLLRCTAAAADALILDLEDSVEPARKPHARGLVAEFLRDRRARSHGVWVRINALGTAECSADIESVMAGGPEAPDGLVVPKARSAGDVVELGHWLDEHEGRFDVAAGRTRLMPIATETPAAVLTLESYLRCGRRLAALSWGAEDLCVALGATTNVDERGEWLPPYQLARSLCLLAAGGAGVPAVDTVFTNLRDHAGLERSATAARRDGFAGKLAIHPEQVEIINRAFQPSSAEVTQAQRIVAAFEAAGTGVVALDGRMLDRPHLLRARHVLNLAAQIERAGS
jgi:citrate lyase subunit beta/citryl-CoA lyase